MSDFKVLAVVFMKSIRCFKKSFTSLNAYIHFSRGYVQFLLS
jgi:hypothetical protein